MAVLLDVAGVEPIDVGRGDGARLAQLVREEHGAGDVFHHDGRLERGARRGTDREDAVVGEQHGGRAMAAEDAHDLGTDVLAADELEAAARDRSTELVSHRGEEAGKLSSCRRPGRGVGAVRVDDPADLGHRPVDVGVAQGVARRLVTTIDDDALEVALDHVLRGEVVEVHPRRLDHEGLAVGVPAAHVAARPRDETVNRELAVRSAHGPAQVVDGAHVSAPELRATSRSRFMTSLPPRPKWSCRSRYSRWRRS